MLHINDLSLGKKLIGGFTLVIILLAIVGFIGYSGINTVGEHLDEVLNKRMVFADKSSELEMLVMDQQKLARDHINGNKEAAVIFDENKKKIDAIIADLEEKGADKAAIDSIYSKYREFEELVLAPAGSGRMQELEEREKELNTLLLKFKEDQNMLMMASGEDARNERNYSILLIAISVVIAAFTGIVLGFYISRSITRPMNEMVLGAKDIADGKLEVKIRNTSKDEIGTLSNTFQTMANELQEVIRDVNQVLGALSEGDLSREVRVKARGDFEKITTAINNMNANLRDVVDDVNNVLAALSKGDLTKRVRVEAKGDFRKITAGINTMQENLRQLILTLNNSAERVASTSKQLLTSSNEMKASANQVSCNSQDIAQGVNQQALKISEISRAMKEMYGSVEQVAVNSQKAAEGADNANKTAQEVGHMSGEVAKKMTQIQAAVINSSTVIKELEIKSQQIGEIIEVITNIADQTNMLALNAAIEAARAGEHGRGFAVVADEVRKLAEESRNAADQITSLIKEVQLKTKKAVESMDQGTKTVNDGAQIIGSTASSVNNIVIAAGNVATMIQEIAATTEEQSASLEEVSASIDDVSNISQASAANTQEASAAAQEQMASMEMLAKATNELAALAEELKAEVAKFNLDDNENAGHKYKT